MINVLVTGGKGQLACNLRNIDLKYPELNLFYKSSSELDIVNYDSLEQMFSTQKIDYCINCAAYTNVDHAEKDSATAFSVNEIGVKNLAKICSEKNVVLIHISTDFVFDGKKTNAYTEKDNPNPIGVYGLSKLNGEIAIKSLSHKYFIFRTSWLYSEYSKNFMKTMIGLSKTKEELKVVDDQIGTPTYARDLAEVILNTINNKNRNYGIYHYSNEGVASWYDFAHAIFDEIKSNIQLFPIKTKQYPTPAKRPCFSVLDKSKIKEDLKVKIPHWKYSLKIAIDSLNKNDSFHH